MSHVLTIKLPHSLLERLKQASRLKGKSKGAVVRESLDQVLEQETPHLNQIKEITQALLKGKKIRRKVDWETLRKKAAMSAGYPSPEEEVRLSRRRRL